jgi:hypothetical protein
MDEGDKGRLNEILELSRENQRMIKTLYRSFWWQRVGSVIYWLVIIGIVLGAYVWIEPYLGRFGVIYDKLKAEVEAVKDTSEAVKSVF